MCHPCLHEFVVECSVCILKASVTVEQGVSTWICLYSLIKGFEYKRVIVAFTNDIGHNTPIIEIQNGTEIDFMYFNTFIPFELGYIGQPFSFGFSA